MNPYEILVSQYVRGFKRGTAYPLGKRKPASAPILKPDAAKALIFSPHPDDECITGGLALRLSRDAGMRVINVAVTLGTNKSRRTARLRELRGACGYLGFEIIVASRGGFEGITPEGRSGSRARWRKAVAAVAEMLMREKPRVIFMPHEQDRHPTHIGTHLLVVDALKRSPKKFKCHVVETEYWGAMDTPNLMVESSEREVTDLVTALSFHAGEVRRNPFHLTLPAWMQDNLRRGSEIVGERGGKAPDFIFATLYRMSRWRNGRLEPALKGGRQLACESNPAKLFGR